MAAIPARTPAGPEHKHAVMPHDLRRLCIYTWASCLQSDPMGLKDGGNADA